MYGPMQIESRIDQDQNISKDLSLWNQQGSHVLRGSIIALPVSGGFFYVESFRPPRPVCHSSKRSYWPRRPLGKAYPRSLNASTVFGTRPNIWPGSWRR